MKATADWTWVGTLDMREMVRLEIHNRQPGQKVAMDWGYRGEGEDSRFSSVAWQNGEVVSREGFCLRNVWLESGRHHCGGPGK